MVIVDSVFQSSWIFILAIFHVSFVLTGVNVPNLFRFLLGETPWIPSNDLEFSYLMPSLFILKDIQTSYYTYTLLVSIPVL